MLEAREEDVPVATRMVPDRRAVHYWDGSGLTMVTYQEVLELPGDAWDVYLLYGPTVRWEGDRPPKPDYWMHQLRAPGVPGPFLDAAVFAGRTQALLTPTLP